MLVRVTYDMEDEEDIVEDLDLWQLIHMTYTAASRVKSLVPLPEIEE